MVLLSLQNTFAFERHILHFELMLVSNTFVFTVSIVGSIQRIFGRVIELQFAYCFISLSLCIFLVGRVSVDFGVYCVPLLKDCITHICSRTWPKHRWYWL